MNQFVNFYPNLMVFIEEIQLFDLLDNSLIISLPENEDDASILRTTDRDNTLACNELDVGEIQVLFE